MASQSFVDLLEHTARDIHPPGYYVLLRIWTLALGPAPVAGFEFMYAFPSVLFGVLLIAIGRPIIRTFRLPEPVAGLYALATLLHPFHIWYSQEVRMYTLASFGCLLSLYVSVNWFETKRQNQRTLLTGLIVSVVGAINLYTLYYTALFLAGVGLFITWRIMSQFRSAQRNMTLLNWSLVNGLLALLWVPWMPKFWRQLTEPPVPTWREGWQSMGDMIPNLVEAAAALLVGQTLTDRYLFLAGFVLVILVFAPVYNYAKYPDRVNCILTISTWCLFWPIVVLFLVSASGYPLYHVRYLFIFSPIALMLLATSLAALSHTSTWLPPVLLTIVLVVQSAGLYEYATKPELQPDDHRGTVRRLAAAWRPGDSILLNAGWIYPVVMTYWPDALYGQKSVPPPIGNRVRLDDVPHSDTLDISLTSSPTLVMAGSIDGPPSLGWGLEQSDFYPSTQAGATRGLDYVVQKTYRIWHYRLYDTVNDPDGLLRSLLTSRAQLLYSQPIGGRDFGRLELYATRSGHDFVNQDAQTSVANFGQTLSLHTVTTGTIVPGRYYYAEFWWQRQLDAEIDKLELAMSLRLYDQEQQVVVQLDESPALPTSAWQPNEWHRQVLALPIPHDLSPDTYTIGLLVYDRTTLEPLAVTSHNHAESPTIFAVQQVRVP